jgi:hypothetical protein
MRNLSLVLLLLTVLYAFPKISSAMPLSKNTEVLQSLENLQKFKIKTLNEIEYWWVLYNDGCYHLYRVEIVGGLLEFWTPLGYWNYIGATTACAFSYEEMDVMC